MPKPSTSSETQGVMLQTKTALLPLGALTVQNLGKDGALFYCRVLCDGKPATNRISGATEEKAMAAGMAIIKDIAHRIEGSEKNQRLVISL